MILKNLKRAGALALCAAMILGVMAGCTKPQTTSSTTADTSNQNTSSENADTTPDYMNPVGEYPITKEKVEVSAFTVTVAEAPEDWNELKIYKDLSEKTNIHMNYTSAVSDAFDTQLSIKMAGNDYPDVLLMGMNASEEESYGPAGKWLDLTDLIANYMPNLQKVMNEVDEVNFGVRAMDGSIYGLPNYTASVANVPTLSFFNSKWMERVGITEFPKTTDEFYDLLMAFKEKDANGNGDPNDEIPFSCVGIGYFSYIQSAFQGYTGTSTVSSDWDVTDDGKVVYLPQEAGYKEYLEFCHKMYVNGLLDNDFIAQSSDDERAKVKANLVGFYNQSPTIVAGTEMAEEQQICLEPLTSPTNSKKVAIKPGFLATTAGVITKNCKYPEAVARWFDMFYATEENAVDGFYGLTSFLGYENDTWKYTDDTKNAYSFIDPITTFTDLDKATTITYTVPAYIDLSMYISGNVLLANKIEESKKKLEPYYREAYPAYVRFNSDESETSALYSTDLDNYRTQMEAGFISGTQDLSQFDDFQNKLVEYGVEKLKAIKQAAYDRYVASTKQ